MYISISYFLTFFQIPIRNLKKKILNNVDYKREGLKKFEN